MIRIYGATDRGCVRTTNQDAFTYKIIDEETAFAVVCDGMGGEKGGHIASARAVEVISMALTRSLNAQTPVSSIKSMLIAAISAANAVIYETAQADPELKGMGTTVVALVIREDTLCLAHAGDSRAYQFAERALCAHRLTHDHSVVQLLLDNGEITEREARVHPKRNYITRALGVERNIDVEYYEQYFRVGRLLLCSDGLYNYAPPDDHLDLITSCVSEQDLWLLIDEANKAGGPDNITAVIVVKETKPRRAGGKT
ncbi:MAG: Stp1/IreP family PP2C-type Ser/Thr phosphatase [Anaerotruncus sp.]|nr:Stp1/IreP family PP2C-type Ser/Thr phosphatase [Anaerotruncus sp.]